MKSESWPVVGFCPHVASTRVSGINLNTLYPNFGPLRRCLAQQTRQSDYTALSSSLSHRSSIILNFGAAPSIHKAKLGALYTPNRAITDSSCKAEKISKDLKPLEQLTSSRRIMTVSFRLSLLRCSSEITRTQSQ